MGSPPLRSVNADMPTDALSAILQESKPSGVRFSHPESSTLLQALPLSEPPLDVLLMGFSLLGAQALAYGLPSSEPTGR